MVFPLADFANAMRIRDVHVMCKLPCLTAACIASWCSCRRSAMLSSTARPGTGSGCASQSLAVTWPTTTPPVTCTLLPLGKIKGSHDCFVYLLTLALSLPFHKIHQLSVLTFLLGGGNKNLVMGFERPNSCHKSV